MPGRLQNRVALITGASSGIGRAIALAYHAEGARVACSDLKPGTWREEASGEDDGPTHEKITKAGGQAIFVQCDVSKAEQVEAAVARVVQEWGRLDIMVNNAGFLLEARAPAPIWELPLDIYHKSIDVMVGGMYYGIKYASKQMISQEPLQPGGDVGWIINAASAYGTGAEAHVSAYCTAKGAVVNLTRAAALDCAPSKIHVNSVSPGFTATHLTDAAFAHRPLKKAIDLMHPFKGAGRPEDVAAAYVFLASDDAAWISGAILPVDGAYGAKSGGLDMGGVLSLLGANEAT